MRESTNEPRYLMRWDLFRDQSVCRDVFMTTHRLGEVSLFSDDLIADLIDRHPHSAMTLSTMGDCVAHSSEWQAGQLGDHSGAQLLAMIRRGRLHLTIRNLGQHQPSIAAVIDRLCQEVVECDPGLRIIGSEGHLLISSPSAFQYYHSDMSPGMRWQIRGSSRVWTYPQGDPYLPEGTIEQIVSGQRVDTLYYEPAFDDQAQLFDVPPGQMLTLPQYTPHRTANLDGLNITLKIEYRTPEVIRRNRIHVANRLLRRYLPFHFDSHHATGIGAVMKQVLANLAGSGRHPDLPPGVRDAHRLDGQQTFRVEANAINCILPLGRSVPQPSGDTEIFPMTIEMPVAVATVLEN